MAIVVVEGKEAKMEANDLWRVNGAVTQPVIDLQLAATRLTAIALVQPTVFRRKMG